MTPAVDGGPVVRHGPDDGKAETLVASKDASALKQPLFKSLMPNDDNELTQSPDFDGSKVPLEPVRSDTLQSEGNLDSVADDSLVNPEGSTSSQPPPVTVEQSVVNMPDSVAGERGDQLLEVPTGKAPVADVIKYDGMQEEMVKLPPVLSGTVSLSTPPAPELSPSQNPGTHAPAAAPVEKLNTGIQLSANVGKEAVLNVPVQNFVRGSVSRNSLSDAVKSSPVNSAVTVSDEEIDPLPHRPMPVLKDESKPVTPKDTSGLMNSIVEKKSIENNRSRLNQITLDKMPVVEYRNTNQTSMAMVQPLTEVATQPMGMAVVTEASQSARVDAGLTTPQSAPRLQSNLAHDASTHIKMMVSRGIGRAAVQLNPADLGAMHINIDLKADQLTVQISVAQSATREVMEAALPRLREQLEAEGYSGITIDLNNESLNEQESDRNTNSKFGLEHSSVTAADTSDTPEVTGTPESLIKNNLIDLFA